LKIEKSFYESKSRISPNIKAGVEASKNPKHISNIAMSIILCSEYIILGVRLKAR